MKRAKAKKTALVVKDLGAIQLADTTEDVPPPTPPGTFPNPVPIAKPDKKVIV